MNACVHLKSVLCFYCSHFSIGKTHHCCSQILQDESVYGCFQAFNVDVYCKLFDHIFVLWLLSEVEFFGATFLCVVCGVSNENDCDIEIHFFLLIIILT